MKLNRNENSTSKNNSTQSSLHAAATFLPGDLTATVWSGGGYITNSQCAMLAHDSNNPARSYSIENFKYPFFIKLLYVTNIKMNIKVV